MARRWRVRVVVESECVVEVEAHHVKAAGLAAERLLSEEWRASWPAESTVFSAVSGSVQEIVDDEED